MLYVWKLMGMDRGDSELYMAGDIPNIDKLCAELKQFVSKYHVLELASDFNNAAIATHKRYTIRPKGIVFRLKQNIKFKLKENKNETLCA